MKQISNQEQQGLLAKFIFAFLLGFLSVSVQAQTELTTAKNYLSANATKQKLSASDIAEMSVSSEYRSPTTGWYHIYFNQTYQSVEVYNGLLNVTLNNGQVGYVANSFVPDLASKIPSGALKIKLSPIQALQKAASSVNLTASSSALEVSKTFLSGGIINKISYLDPSISNEKIDVKLYWLPYEAVEGAKTKPQVVLTWNVRITTKDGKNSWNTHVDALSGNILKTHDDVIHCNFGTPEHNKTPHICIDNLPYSADSKVLLGNTYNVFDYPLEAPTFGGRTVVSSPYTKFVPTGTGPGATNGWHNDGTTNFTNTRGNNVFAKEDLANDDETTIGASPSSATLDFNFPYSQTTGTAAANINAAITNMFYWNNVMHDVLWKYGFDEPGGNFQKDNMSRGGTGNDFVFADAQDGSGTNNANFATPTDGTNPRMQMYIFSNAGSPAYQPDSDFDNGVIAHEYGHGWSTRLTGGPANSDCLNNAEQGGEGWSDYIALMTTTNWATLMPTVASANIPRGIGTYVLGQATTGAGIRPFRYSYNKTNINNTVTYAGVGNTAVFSLPHGIGSIWATMLWDMTWEIILQDNYIENNIYNVPTNITDYKGNIAALKLVNEGLRLQPCSPSFVQARDAILQADLMLFGGRYKCSIWKAFARRGLGFYASTGVSTNDRTVTEDFTPLVSPALNSALTGAACSNQVFTYTATTASVGAFTYTWTRAAVAGISNSAGSGNTVNASETLINTTPNPVTVKYIFTISPNECGGMPLPQTVNVVVSSGVVPAVATYTVCKNTSVPSGEGLAVPASVPITTVNGVIATGPTYVRGSGDNVTIYTASRPVFYKTYTFVAPASGAVTLATTAAVLSSGDDDTYLTLYQNSFNPASPATNFLIGNDDISSSNYLSSVTKILTAGTTYIVVVSTFETATTGTFTLQASSAVFGQTVNWYLNASGGTPLATGSVFNPVGVAGSGIPNTATIGSTNFYVADAVYPDCRTATTFTISSSVGGSVTAETTVCSGTNGATLTLAGHTGTVLSWESSIDNFVTPLTITNTTTTQAYLNLTQTTKYRAVVQNGTCTVANSSPTTITVLAPAIPVATGASIFLGNSVTLTATGCTEVGFVLNWFETLGNVPVTMPVSPITDKQYYAKCEQTLGAMVCSSPKSNDATVTVTSPPLFTIIYVNQANANPTQDGLTWATAFSNLSSGLAIATAGTEVWVATGTYKPTTTTDRTISFVVPSGVKMIGGFAGTETASTQRDFRINLSILSGEIGNLGNLTDNTYHVVRLNNADNTTVIDGFVITKGFAASTPPTPLIEPIDGVPSAAPSVIEVNAGGGILAENSLATITNCTIISNQATFGGGVFMSSGSAGTISFCKIAGNLATFGGGIYNFACNPDINNSQITGNKALGGGIYNNDADPTITNVTIAANNGFLGSIYNTPTAPIESNPVLKNCIIWDNSGTLQTNSSIINYSIVQSNYLGTINLMRDPMFVSPQPPEVAPITTGDYHIKINSPCTDTGDNTGISLTVKDLDNNLRRFSGGRVDRGAYEFQGIGGGIVISTRTGGWDDPITWDINRVPYPSDIVIIDTNHIVTITGNSNAKNVEYRTNGKVFFMNAASKLFVGF